MPSQNGPSEKVKAAVQQSGGKIWTTCTNVVAGGVAVARAVIEQHRVPDAARMLLGWRPVESVTLGAVAESVVAVFDLAGANYKHQPQEVIGGCVADSFLATGSNLVAHSEYYDVFAPFSGGETIEVGVEPCDAIAGNRRSMAEFTWTDVVLPLPTIYSLCSREIAIAIAAVGIVNGAALAINKAHKLIEVMGIATHSIATVLEELTVTAILKCTVWDPVQEIAVQLEPCSGCAVTPGVGTAYVTRSPQSVNFTKETATITMDADVDIALAAAGQFVHGIRYI